MGHFPCLPAKLSGTFILWPQEHCTAIGIFGQLPKGGKQRRQQQKNMKLFPLWTGYRPTASQSSTSCHIGSCEAVRKPVRNMAAWLQRIGSYFEKDKAGSFKSLEHSRRNPSSLARKLHQGATPFTACLNGESRSENDNRQELSGTPPYLEVCCWVDTYFRFQCISEECR